VTYALTEPFALRTKGSDISKLRTVVTIASITAVATFGVVACGSNKSSTGASAGGEINVSMTSFPDYVTRSSPTHSKAGKSSGTPTLPC
jgi:hypothetical protein